MVALALGPNTYWQPLERFYKHMAGVSGECGDGSPLVLLIFVNREVGRRNRYRENGCGGQKQEDSLSFKSRVWSSFALRNRQML